MTKHFLIALIIISGLIFSMEKTLAISYITTYPDFSNGTFSLGTNNDGYMEGQGFYTGTLNTIDSVKLRLLKNYATDGLKVQIYTCINSCLDTPHVLGNLVAESESIDSSMIPQGAFTTNTTFNFTSPVIVNPNSYYTFWVKRTGVPNQSYENYQMRGYLDNNRYNPSNCLALDGYRCHRFLMSENTFNGNQQIISRVNDDLLFEINGTFGDFWSKIENIQSLSLRSGPGLDQSIIRTLPNSWVVKVLSSTDDYIEANGYRWYKVQDPTDSQIGWIAGINLTNGLIYLNYNSDPQSALEAKTTQQGTEIDGTVRKPIIENAVDGYMNSSNTGNSLYNVGGGLNGNNNFSGFISDEEFPRELFLGIISRESGGAYFNNRKCGYADDGGIGIMQITTAGFKGLGSGLRDNAKATKYTGDCWGPDFSNYYSNSTQGIWANIKDGFRTLQEKHTSTLNKMASQNWLPNCPLTIGTTTLSCNDLKKIVTTWSYNSFKIYDAEGNRNNYLGRVADQISNLNSNFSNINSTVVADLVTKLNLANKNKEMIKLHSPGELSILDSSNNRTGIWGNSGQSENILFSAYDPDEKGSVIFSPSDDYSYIVQGTGTGVYGLSIDYNNNSETPTSIFTQNIPMTHNMVHKYTVDWIEVANNENGVHIDVDKDGNGTYDYGFDASPTLNDTIAPTSSISLSGTTGDNGWHKSDVAVTLSATDNATGAGVYRVHYSMNNGLTWNVYSSPFVISNEGTTQILYYSEDYVLNKEPDQSLTIKIDKINPEAEIYFDVATEGIKVAGTDNLTTPTVTQTGMYSYSIKDDSGRELKIDLTGHIDFSPITNTYQFTGEISGLQYNTDIPITIPLNAIGYSWQDSTNPNLLQQNVHVEDQFDVSATYNSLQNNTHIVVNTPAGQINETLGGIVSIIITTENGILGFDY